jgi:hypothetical protein
MFVRDPNNDKYMLWEDGSCKPVNSLNSVDYPFAEKRVNNLAVKERSPDIILSTRKPYYYAGKGMKGEHGSLHRDDSQVPLIFMYTGLGAEDVSRDVQVIDISPTIAESMGFLTQLKQVGTPKENLVVKLPRILDALETHLDSKLYEKGAKILKRVEDSLAMDKINREWAWEEFDMRENFERKVKRYLGDGTISQNEYSDLVGRYKNIISKKSKDPSVTGL